MWKEVRKNDRYERHDNAVVLYDHTVECDTARPWLPHHRGFKAYGPGEDQHNYIGFFRKNSKFRVVKKFKTPESAMKAVDALWPPSVDKSPD